MLNQIAEIQMSDFIRVKYNEATSLDFKPPCTFYIRNAMDEFVFIKTRNRKVAQELINAEYGRGKYTVASSKLF